MRCPGWPSLRRLYRGRRTGKRDQRTRNQDREYTFQASRSSYSYERKSRSSHLQFPPEITSHIFIQYAPPIALFDRDNRSAPLYLGAVCRKWRQLAWATPRLWSLLLVGFRRRGKYNCINESDLPQLVAEWLERSATSSLSLTIRLDLSGQGFEDHRDGVYCDVMNILNKHSGKWYDMHFSLPMRHLHRLHGSLQENILRRLLLCHHRPFFEPSQFSTFSMIHKPSPTDLTLVAVGLPYVDIIWNNLTIASVDEIGDDECVELVRRAPLLESLSLRGIRASSGLFPFLITRIIRPHLHSLELSRISGEDVVAAILDSVCFPSLKQWIHDDSPLPLDSMISFLGYLSSCLKVFKISIGNVNHHQVNQLLWNLSSLEFLELRIGNQLLSDLDFLYGFLESPLFLPHLQSLEFIGEFSFPWECLLPLFAPSHRRSLRVKVNTRLGRLHNITEETVTRLQELVDKGFDLKLFRDGRIDLL